MSVAGGFACERFGPERHNWRKFRSSNSVFDIFLRSARRDDPHSPAVIYVLNDDATNRIIGYYAISTTSVERETFPDDFREGLRGYPSQPAMLIGRLAVDAGYLGKEYGGDLLLDALRRCLLLRQHVGFVAVIVDAIDANAVAFYRHHAFIPFPETADRLFLPVGTIARLFGDGEETVRDE